MTSSPTLPFSQACENNKAPILARLTELFTAPGTVLEIGSGTGQHAVYFAKHLPYLIWQPSDQPRNHLVCLPRLEDAGLPNLNPPLALDVRQADWALPSEVQGVFSANTAHIMSWPEVERLFEGVGAILEPNRLFCLYGPFKYDGQHTSDSNDSFDRHLREQNRAMGIRDLADLRPLANRHGLYLDQDLEMPANNRLLVWRRER